MDCMTHDALFMPGRTTGSLTRIPLSNDVHIDLIWCASATFFMGSDATDPEAFLERPQHRVRLTRGFWISRTPVTQQQWIEVVHSGLPRFEQSPSGFALPAEGMDWDLANAFCLALTTSLRHDGLLAANQVIDLPTEAQWEF